ncbi:hypothetical protein BJV77DRAFT_1031691 [Russula vinacea]|nr:hypothetical protein BJV77DRAFT_1031691 [Russula vinacea]
MMWHELLLPFIGLQEGLPWNPCLSYKNSIYILVTPMQEKVFRRSSNFEISWVAPFVCWRFSARGEYAEGAIPKAFPGRVD